MKTCKYTNKDIYAYLSNRMSEKDEIEFQFHLASCDFCRTAVEERRHLNDGFSENKAPSVSLKNNNIKTLLSITSIAASIIIGYFIFQQPESNGSAFEQQSLTPIQKNCIDSIPSDSTLLAIPCQK